MDCREELPAAGLQVVEEESEVVGGDVGGDFDLAEGRAGDGQSVLDREQGTVDGSGLASAQYLLPGGIEGLERNGADARDEIAVMEGDGGEVLVARTVKIDTSTERPSFPVTQSSGAPR